MEFPWSPCRNTLEGVDVFGNHHLVRYGDLVGAGSRSYRKSCYIGTGESKKTVPKQSRRESSTTTLKEAAKIGGLSYPHKGKGAMGRGIEDEGQK